MGAAGPYWVTAHPVSWLPYELPAGDDRQISSEDRRSVKLRVRPPPTGTHQCHRATPTGRRIMLTVKLMRGGRDDPSMARYRSSFSRHTSPHPSRRTPASEASGGAPTEVGVARLGRDSVQLGVDSALLRLEVVLARSARTRRLVVCRSGLAASPPVASGCPRRGSLWPVRSMATRPISMNRNLDYRSARRASGRRPSARCARSSL